MAVNDVSDKQNTFSHQQSLNEAVLKRASENFFKITDEHKYKKASDTAENDASQKQIRESRQRQVQERDAGFTKLVERFVDHYGDKYLQNKEFKDGFFKRVLLLFTITLISPFIVLVFVALGALDGVEVIAAFLSTLGSIITSIVVIPKIIAEYLFSLKEDETIIKIISELHSGDIQNIDPGKPPK